MIAEIGNLDFSDVDMIGKERFDVIHADVPGMTTLVDVDLGRSMLI